MKTTRTGTPCWVLSSHDHPCAAPGSGQRLGPDAPAPGAARRAVPLPRRLRLRPADAAAYWLQADTLAGSRLG